MNCSDQQLLPSRASSRRPKVTRASQPCERETFIRSGSLDPAEAQLARLVGLNRGMARLVAAVQELSLTRDLAAIMTVVRRAARELTGADGATFVLRDGDLCHYADEDAIAPLWKGQRFPLGACISGWTMLHRQPAVIEDIYADRRIPADAYRPTFVKSLAMVPIRTAAPIGAIGNYWAERHLPTAQELELLQALANTTAVAMENAQLYAELEQRVKDRTAKLEAANQELEAFSYAVSHDLAAPLRHIRGYADLLEADGAKASAPDAQQCVSRIRARAESMTELIGSLLQLSKVSRTELVRQKVNLSAQAEEITGRFTSSDTGPKTKWDIAPGIIAEGDPVLLRVVMENLLSNAWKYTRKCEHPVITFTAVSQPGGSVAYQVRDNGAGFDMERVERLFKPFQRLHRREDFPGSGIGLATVQRIVRRHGGRVWAEGAVGKGAAFHFTLV